MALNTRIMGRGDVDLFAESVQRLVHYIHGCVDSSKSSGYPLAAFRHEGQWYFRSSWLDRATLETMIEKDFVENVGTYRDLRRAGIISLYFSRRNIQTNGKSTFYRVKNPKVNSLISEASS